MVKTSKYSIKSETVTHRCTIKKQFWRVLNISQKRPYTWASFETKLQNCCLSLKKALPQMFSYKVLPNITDHFFWKTRPGDCICKIPFCLSRQSQHQMLPLNLLFEFYFNYCQIKHFSFLNAADNLARNELIYCW